LETLPQPLVALITRKVGRTLTSGDRPQPQCIPLFRTPMKRIPFGVTCIAALSFVSVSILDARETLRVQGLKCELRENPAGVDTPSPHLSWESMSTGGSRRQTAYQILVADDPAKIAAGVGNIWDSKKVFSDQSLRVRFDGQQLASAKRYYWKVRVWGESGDMSDWSQTASWQMGLLNTADWAGARWIGYETLPDSLRLVPGVHGNGDDLGTRAVQRPVVPVFRKEFTATNKITEATLFICGLGQYDASINGAKVGKSYLTPGWTRYDKTCLYNTYDVLAFLKAGSNVLGVIVGNGFHNINRERYRKLVIAFGMPKLICLLKITYQDGSTQTLVSGHDWKCAPSPITYTSIYGGEDYDARREVVGWDSPPFDDARWKNALIVAPPEGILKAEFDYPVEVCDVFAPTRIVREDSSAYLYDFGQNASGIVELTVAGRSGLVVKLIPGELLHGKTSINQQASGSPYYFSYTLKGTGAEVWRPRFTYYGFRYVRVEGAAPDTAPAVRDLPRIVDLKFLHTRNSAPASGSFSCSDTLFNRIYSLIDWAVKSNLQSVVTDCPHREKLAWLEQTHLMGSSLHYGYRLYNLYKKIIGDMIDSQTPSGLVPDIAPEYVEFLEGFRDSPEWGSAAVILPWMMYQWYGDKETLARSWPMMKKYVSYLETKAVGHILSHGLGDWCDLGPRFTGFAQLTPVPLTATAIYYRDIMILAEASALLGYRDEHSRWTELSKNVKKAFNQRFFKRTTHTYATGSQTAMAMPLCVGLVEDEERSRVFENLVDSIRSSGNALTAGDVGFHFLVQALTEGGASQVLSDMISRTDVPGYGYQLKRGATALTESWPAFEEVSNNHLMLGHVMEWFYAGLGGIRQEKQSVAFKNIIIDPWFSRTLTRVNVRYDSPYGPIRSEWSRIGEELQFNVEIPFNTKATVYLPSADPGRVTEHGRPIKERYRPRATNTGALTLRLSAGAFEFRIR
jgi:alpha-L-rhamnosidase